MKIFMVGLVGELTEQNWLIIRVILCTTSSDQDERVLTILYFVFVIVVPISKTEKSSYFSNHFFNSSLDQTGMVFLQLGKCYKDSFHCSNQNCTSTIPMRNP